MKYEILKYYLKYKIKFEIKYLNKIILENKKK